LGEELHIDPTRPVFRGLEYLLEQVLQHIAAPTTRQLIKWKELLWSEFGWKAHPYQAQLMSEIFDLNKKVVVVRAGKRSGKSNVALAAARAVHKSIPSARGWVASGSYDLSDRVFMPIFNDIGSGVFGKVLEKNRKDRRCQVEGGGLVQGKSWDDPDSLEGESLDYCICDEAQTLDQHRFDLLYARTVDRNGFILLIGSADSSDAFFLGLCEKARIEPDWGYLEWTIWDNPYIDRTFIEKARRDLSEEAFAEMFENKDRMPTGLVFGKENDERVNMFRNGEPNYHYPMEIWVDPGTTSSAYAVGFVQIIGDDVRMYDEVCMNNTFSEEVIEVVRDHEYWGLVRSGVMDIAGRTKHDRSESPKDIWTRITGIPFYDHKVDLLLGYERHKTFLREPGSGRHRFKYHERCKKLRLEYRTHKYPPRTTHSAEARRPIDADNHMIKAITYGLVHHFGYFDKKTPGMGNRRVV
jgi:hypothetical protein